MISVKFESNIEKREASMFVGGHAGYADKGNDIICSSASILASTVAQYVELMDNQGDLAEKPIICLKDGYAIVTCIAKDDDAYAYIMQAFFVCRLGYQLLAQNYPQYVEMIDVDAFIG